MKGKKFKLMKIDRFMTFYETEKTNLRGPKNLKGKTMSLVNLTIVRLGKTQQFEESKIVKT